MKRFLIILGIVSGAIVMIGLILFITMTTTANNALESMVYEDVAMSQAADGTFQGITDAGMVSVKVAVTVKGHAINHIDIIEHKNGQGAPAEAITQDMVAANSYDVDAVSGATLSSEAIKSAVSKALKASCQQSAS
jgi:uncharacterized protein with FMN-binding domain